MKILITGVNGIVGSELINSLPINYEIYTITNKKLNKAIKKKITHNLIYKNNYFDLEKFVFSVKPDAVIHLATKWKKIDNQNKKEIIESNIIFSSFLIDICSKINLKFFINTSTYTQLNEKGAYKPFNFYSASKYAFEKILYYYFLNSKTKVINLRIMNVYGSLKDSRIVNYVFKAIHNKQKKIIINDIDAKVDLVHIEDVVGALNSILISKKKDIYRNFTYDISSRQQISLFQLIKSIEKVCSYKFALIENKKVFNQYLKKPFRGKKLINWSNKISLQNGLKKTHLLFYPKLK
jgi:nucleoside-diphosphate-sugar epimerase